MSAKGYTLKVKQDMPVFIEFAETAGHPAHKHISLCTKEADGTLDTEELGSTFEGRLTATMPAPIPFGKQPFLFVYGKIYPLPNTPDDYRAECTFQARGQLLLLGPDDREIPSRKIVLTGKLSDITRIDLNITVVKE